MFSTNQIAEFLNQLFLQNKSMTIRSYSKFFLVGHDQNMGVANLVSGLQNRLCLLKVTDFLYAGRNSCKLKDLLRIVFAWAWPKYGRGQSGDRTIKLFLKNK